MGESRVKQAGQRSERRKRYERKRRIRRWKRRLRYGAVGVAAVATVVLLTVVLVNRDPDDMGYVAPNRDVADATSTTDAAMPPTYLVVGDSYSGGSKENDGPEWIDQIATANGWSLAKNAIGGSGYVNDGQGESVTTRLPSVLVRYGNLSGIILAAGINDVGRVNLDDFLASVETSLDNIAAEQPGVPVVLLSPFASGTPPSSATDAATAMADLAAERGIGFVDVTDVLDGRDDLIGTDNTHPTDEGHTYLAEMIGPLLDEQFALLS